MHEVTRILNAIEQGDPQAASRLLPLVYDELRRLARQELAEAEVAAPEPDDDLLALEAALSKFEATHPEHAELVNLRYFAGLPLPQAAELLGISTRTAERRWTYARAWLLREIRGETNKESK